MNLPTDTTFDLQAVLHNIVRHPLRWIAPAAAITVLALGYAVVRSPKWEAKQALVVRDEAVGRVFTAAGKFASVDDMQTAQETVLELAKSASVVKAALIQAGPAEGTASESWPSLATVEKLKGRIDVKAPNGAEFGRTEVFYLVVEDTNRDRALQLTAAICDALEDRLGQMRNEKANSLVAEMEETVALTRVSLNTATNRLATLEAELGSDLAELRILNEAASGESTLRNSITSIRNELRGQQQSQQANQQLLELLNNSQGDADSIIAMPTQLLQSQPALLRLKEGLVDAQLRTSKALGMMSTKHPQVQAAIEEEKDVRRRLHGELSTAIRGLTVELQMNEHRIASLSKQLSEVQQRMSNIASVRAEYHNLTADVQQRSEAWNQAQHDLADAQASGAASHSASLLTRVDGPQAGAYAAGPSRSMIVLAGAFAGLIFGLGVVVLTTAPAAPQQEVEAAVATESTDRPAAGNRVLTPGGNLSLQDALRRIALGQPATA